MIDPSLLLLVVSVVSGTALLIWIALLWWLIHRTEEPDLTNFGGKRT